MYDDGKHLSNQIHYQVWLVTVKQAALIFTYDALESHIW